MIPKEKIEYQVECFNSTIIPFGSRDIYEAVRVAVEGGHDGYWLAEQVNDYIELTDAKMENLDPNAIAYDALLQEARSEIDKLIDIDILNDTDEQIFVYGNCMCTSLDYTEDAKEELLKILKKIDDENKTKAIEWLEGEMA